MATTGSNSRTDPAILHSELLDMLSFEGETAAVRAFWDGSKGFENWLHDLYEGLQKAARTTVAASSLDQSQSSPKDADYKS